MAPPKGKGPSSLGRESPAIAPPKVFAKLWPWLVGLAILALLVARVPKNALYNALKEGPWLSLGVYTLLQAFLILLADAYATHVSLTITGFRQRFYLIFLARGSTYILGVLNYALGQGALGFYLQRSGVATIRAAGIMLFLLIVNLGVLLAVVILGLMAGGLPGEGLLLPSSLVLGLLTGMIVYLSTVSLRPQFLQNYQLLAPLLDAGLSGHLRAIAGRVPHIMFLVVTYWGALRLWGIPVPLVRGVVMVPIVLFLGALPVTPVGLGTTQAALVVLFSPYVPLASPEAQGAAMLAFGLAYYFLGILAQALLGFWCWQRLRRVN